MRFIFHEVSSPLNNINMGLEALKAEALDSDGRETLSTVIASTEDIHNVLEIFRAQVKNFIVHLLFNVAIN